jgi:hypothetical protein
MFRLMKLKPPHGWNAVAWELGIVTLGVIVALAAQQWAEERSWQDKVKASKAALRDELAEHYGYAVEYRTVYPCLEAQVERLRERVLSSGTTLQPATVYREPGDEYVLRMPTKYYPTDAWEEALNEGAVERLDPAIRRQFAGHYASLVNVARLGAANSEAEGTLMALAQPLPLDASVRYAIIKDMEGLRGRLRFLDILNGQVIDYIQHIGMVPPAGQAITVTQRYGTYKFCKAHGLPMRSFKDAMVAVPN